MSEAVTSQRTSEIDEKVARVARFAQEHRLGGVLLSRQPNFAWLSGGQSNGIDTSDDAGAGALLVTSDGDRHVIANNIELPRLRDEALRDHGFTPVEYPWRDDHADPTTAIKRAQQIVRGPLGSDNAGAGATDVAALIASLQVPLTDDEIGRYRELGRDVAHAIEQLCRSLQPDVPESTIAGEVGRVVCGLGARPIVNLVAADDRIAAFRHPVPTSRRWTRTLMIGICAERGGLVVALSRMIARSPDASLLERTGAAAHVYGALLAATQPGVTGAQMYVTAANAYRGLRHQGQERMHHQGGAIGYRSRDWIAHPGSGDVVQDRQAFAWNPSITGTKVEETALLVNGDAEVITLTPEWPSIDVASGDGRIRVSGILEL